VIIITMFNSSHSSIITSSSPTLLEQLDRVVLLSDSTVPPSTESIQDPISWENSTLSSAELDCFVPSTIELVPSSAGERGLFDFADFDLFLFQLGQLFLISLYSLTSLVALLGNLTVIVVEVAGSESAATIRKYLINLAVSDIIIGVLCVPFTYTDFMLGQWIFSHWLCPVAQYVQLLSVFVTSLTLTIIGVER